MSDEPAPERIAVVWSPEARADLRAIDRKMALEILHLSGGLSFFTSPARFIR